MIEPNYKRAFDKSDFRGYFTWDQKLSLKLNEPLYHACHIEDLKKILNENQLLLRSECSLDCPLHGKVSVPGVWCGLNDFYKGNNYGPYLIKFPIDVLNGIKFMVFSRKDKRKRYFFVQYESQDPPFKDKDKKCPRVRPADYFNKDKQDKYFRESDSIYDLFLTCPLSIDNAEIQVVKHSRCIPNKCTILPRKENVKKLRRIALNEAIQILSHSQEFCKIMKKYPCLNNSKLNLSDIDLP